MTRYAIVEAPSALGLYPSGVEELPGALLDAGLQDALGARHAGRVPAPPSDPTRDPITGVLNPRALREYSAELARAVTEVLDSRERPVVLGGDCTVLLGCLLALRARGSYGLIYIDGHADFYQPEAEPRGEAASMALALATGRGPRAVSEQLVQDRDVVQLGQRDAEEAERAGSRSLEETDIAVMDAAMIRERRADHAAREALQRLERPDVEGFWVHLDCDVLDDSVMPAVDYRLPGGLAWDELEAVLRVAARSSRLAGLDITIFNPSLDLDGSIARTLVAHLGAGLSPATRSDGRAPE